MTLLRAASGLAVGSLAFLLACGGNTDGDSSSGGGSGGAGTGGSGGAGGSGGLPPQCFAPSSSPGPYAVTFRFQSTVEAYLYRGCQLRMTVTSCADGYTDSLSLSADCTGPCGPGAPGCVMCGACMQDAPLIGPGEEFEQSWAGNTFTFGTENGCSCHEMHAAPAGKYRVSVPVYASETDALEGNPSREVSVDFTLPAPGGLVDVNLDP